MIVNDEEHIWVEKYRPQKINDCILPARLKKVLQSYVDNKNIPNLLFEGGPGSGKTTAAKAMCEEAGYQYYVINASLDRGIDVIRTEIVNFASTVSMLNKPKMVILDEADYMTIEGQASFRGVVEKFSKNCNFILTCNFKAKLMDAIDSRMTTISFRIKESERPQLSFEMFKRSEEILKHENVQYNNTALLQIISKYFPDYRKTLGEIQMYSSFGDIDGSIIDHLSGMQNIQELIDALKDRNYTTVRKWVVKNADTDPAIIFRNIYDSLGGIMKKSSIPAAVGIIGKYQYYNAFVADKEINMASCLGEIMLECSFNE